MNLRNKKVELKRDKIVITKTETNEITLNDKQGIGDIKRSCRAELGNIVRQVKELKERAAELKETLTLLENTELDEFKKES